MAEIYHIPGNERPSVSRPKINENFDAINEELQTKSPKLIDAGAGSSIISDRNLGRVRKIAGVNLTVEVDAEDRVLITAPPVPPPPEEHPQINDAGGGVSLIRNQPNGQLRKLLAGENVIIEVDAEDRVVINSSSIAGGSPGTYDDLAGDDIPSGQVAIEQRVKCGTASLCGFGEFFDPSTPPMYYRTMSAEGGYTLESWYGCACGGDGCPWGIDYTSTVTTSGSCNYDKDTCVMTPGITHTIVNTPGACASVGTGGVQSDCGLGPYPSGPQVVTRTSRVVSYSGQCVGGASNACRLAGVSQKITGGASLTLSNPDTEEDARARLRANPNYWSAWGTAQQTASQGARTYGNTFTVCEVEFRLSIGGFPPSYPVNLSITYERRSSSGGSWADYRTDYYEGFADGSGVFAMDTSVVPNQVGYETRIKSAVIGIG